MLHFFPYTQEKYCLIAHDTPTEQFSQDFSLENAAFFPYTLEKYCLIVYDTPTEQFSQ